ncbi:hypothetical protein BaRGS_00035715 [Batillaria attramentaria]|uniref:Uncharacterized protein n=1 Tax=Batillaria attramentaria TaxID=370345 RepID=A0ABD0JDR0_9CAEN
MTSQARVVQHGLTPSAAAPHPKHSSSTEFVEEAMLTGILRNGASSSQVVQHVVLNGESTQRAFVTLPSMTHPKCLVTQASQNRLPSVVNAPRTHQTRESVPQAASPEFEIREQQNKARRREQARRHLSSSLSGPKTVLPELRRTQSFSVAPHLNGRPHVVRDTGSLGHKPSQDGPARTTGLRRTRSLREDGTSSNPLSLSLPQPPRHVSLSALVHELNTGVHYAPHRRDSRDFSLCDDLDESASNGVDQDDIFEFDPDLFPWRAHVDESVTTPRTLTPALKKLNRRRVSSRVRTQQWVNQIEAKNGRENTNETKTTLDRPSVSLIFEQEI